MWEIPAPMLAASGRPTGSLTGWTAEVKADGFRCQVAVSNSRRVARTRGGHEIADRLPELEVLSRVGVDMILDGELIVGAGRPADFHALAGAVASKRRNRTRTNFVAFDLLAVDGQLLINRPHAERRQLLQHLAVLAPEALTVVSSYPAVDVDDLLVACAELDLEGVFRRPRRVSRVLSQAGLLSAAESVPSSCPRWTRSLATARALVSPSRGVTPSTT